MKAGSQTTTTNLTSLALLLLATTQTLALPQFHQYQSANDDFNIDNFDLSSVGAGASGIVTTITQPNSGNNFLSSSVFHVRDSISEAVGRPCGFKIAPCPYGTYCSAQDPACPAIRGENCAGTCKATKTSPKPHPPPPPPPPRPTPKPAPGTTVYKSCGGFRLPGTGLCDTARGEVCIDDPRALANGSCGMACDAPGICVVPEFCGGFAGFKCKDPNKVCLDDPRDECDPKKGGADCSGICI